MTVEPRYPIEYDGEIDLEPFAKHNWKSAAARDRWREPLNACRDAYPLVEIRAVADSDADRSAAVVDRARLRDPDYVNEIADAGLATTVSHDTAFVGRTEESADLAAEAYADGDDALLGDLLGYPDCCVDAYRDDVDEDYVPPIYEIACRSDCAVEDPDRETLRLDDPDPLLNVLWGHLGWQFVSHVPCAFDCEASREIAAVHGRLYRELGLGEEAEALWEFLATPATWSGLKGISTVRNGYLIGSTNAPAYWSEKTVTWAEEHARTLL
ncbi:DUF483 domain-containing protein [Salinilacihabitans rarus]|uniref:DUF483 domain-containing protein n=1 Tax=Salinilacihabitans rarus TaxID=2961596 RepID=UPI0020C85F83|nr:DUF483 domain-containing protein [Salinilacihabitans rarus]